MERGLFDAMFIADELASYNTHEDSSDAVVEWAVQCPTHEPSTIVPIITAATKQLGVGVTLSTAFEHPYSMCRRLSSLDHLSNGRVAWNIVSSYSKSEWDAYGHSMTDRSGRYERLDEYLKVCYRLWDSWEPTLSLRTKSAAFTRTRPRSKSSITRANTTNVTGGIFARRRRKAVRSCGKPARQIRDGILRQNMRRLFSRSIRMSIA